MHWRWRLPMVVENKAEIRTGGVGGFTDSSQKAAVLFLKFSARKCLVADKQTNKQCFSWLSGCVIIYKYLLCHPTCQYSYDIHSEISTTHTKREIVNIIFIRIFHLPKLFVCACACICVCVWFSFSFVSGYYWWQIFSIQTAEQKQEMDWRVVVWMISPSLSLSDWQVLCTIIISSPCSLSHVCNYPFLHHVQTLC